MSLRRGRFFVPYLFLFSLFIVNNVCCTDSFITNGRSIVAYGEQEAYLITSEGEMYKWYQGLEKWLLYTILTPSIRQMDCLTDGTNLIGTDGSDQVKLWNGAYGLASSWSDPRGSKEYDWVVLDHANNENRGQVKNMNGAWESWDPPTPDVADPWDKYLPAGADGTQKIRDLFVVDADTEKIHRWEKGDLGYQVMLNRSGQTTPFHIYYFGHDPNYAMDRIADPHLVFPSHNIEDVFVRQISYDEIHQNLWCVDQDNKPWQWDNDRQEWILRDIKGDEGFQPPEEEEVPDLLRGMNDFYVRTTYVNGEHKPMVIIYRDSMLLHLVLGELSRGDMQPEFDLIFFDARRPDHRFHTVRRLPKETPQKIVRIDSGKRIRENHYLERLLIEHNIVARHEDIGLYPAEHRIIRR